MYYSETVSMRVCLAIAIVFLTGCLEFLDARKIFGISEGTTIATSVDLPAGRYLSMPTQFDVTFPTTIDMTTVLGSMFTLSETCNLDNPAINVVAISGQIATVQIQNVSGCLNGESVTLTVNFDKIKFKDDSKKGEGSKSYTYTLDTAGPTASAAVGSVSGITATGSYVFNTMPTKIVYTFSSDVDMSSVITSDFTIATAGFIDCSTLPTVSSLTKDSSTGKVTVNLTGGVCSDGESFQIGIASLSVSDQARDFSGVIAGNTGPTLGFDINVTVDSTGVAVSSVGDGATSASGTFGIGSVIDIAVTFDNGVEVTGTPRLKLNTTPVRYAMYSSGSGTSELIFQYTVVYGDSQIDLDYPTTNALQLNGGKISRVNSSGGVIANITLPSPGGVNSLGDNRDIVIDTAVPILVSSSPSGPTDQWGAASRTVTFTLSEEIDPASLDTSDLVIAGTTCASGEPTVTSASLTGASSQIVNFELSSSTCADGEIYTLTFDPANVTDLSSNPGYGSARVITVTNRTTLPTVAVGAPSKLYVNASASTQYLVTYSGASAVTLADGDINFAGASTDCTSVVTGSGQTTRTITIANCSADGSVQISIAASTASNVYGNFADAVDESAITDFNSDNTALTDPTSNLPNFNSNDIYNETTLTNFTLTFTSDVLGDVGSLSAAITLECDAGSGSNPVSVTVSRASDTVMTVAPNESSPDFTYGSSCTLNAINLPDAAGNTFTITPKTFKVGATLSATAGPSGLISRADATTNGNLGLVTFNHAVDSSPLNNTNVTLVCAGQDIALSSLPTSNGDMDVEIDFDETDADWLSLVGTESCTLTFSTAVTDSLGEPLSAPAVFNFSTEP